MDKLKLFTKHKPCDILFIVSFFSVSEGWYIEINLSVRPSFQPVNLCRQVGYFSIFTESIDLTIS